MRFVSPAGVTCVGDGDDFDPITVRVHNASFFQKVACQGNLGMGEAYMAGDFDVEENKLTEFLTLLLRNRLDKKIRQDGRHVSRYFLILLRNWLAANSHNVQRHYDVGEEIFDCFLEDPFQVYSCGYAYSWDDDIESLQRNKLDRICKKVKLERDWKVLDIGCGKAGLLIHAAQHYGAKGVGLTNSRAHHDCAMQNIAKHGLQDRITVKLGDYKEVSDNFDCIVSVGMLEHLRPGEYPEYFATIKSLLKPNGWGLVHAIGKNAAKNNHDPFTQRYIFPGSDTPKLSAISKNVENNNMAIIDVENLHRHYAVTAMRWLEAFRRNSHTLDEAIYDRPFKRMWEYYLCSGTAAALVGDLALYQVLFTNDYFASYPFQRV